MEDSSFMQWAMNTLDEHTFPAAASPVYDIGSFHCGEHTAAAFPSQHALCTIPQPLPTTADDNPDLTVQVDNQYRASSSGDAVVHAAVAGASMPMSSKSVAALTQSAAIGAHKHAGGRRSGSSLQGSAMSAASASSTCPDPAKDHTIAERRRREKINQRLMELSTLIPGIKKMNKATIIGDALKHVRELQEKVKILENNNRHAATTTISSTVFVHKNRPFLSGLTSNYRDDDAGEPSHLGTWLPEIKVRLSDKIVLVQIHCENTNGLLVRVLGEVEVLRLAITHTSSMPFLADTTIINITAKLEEGFNSTVEEMVRRLNSVLDQH
ncbi:transcription factor NAI1-like isoform X2 [Aegilops tauschii subsp. strangulata]|uniref:transcription factor NAI1-like isoform X2 n=1 Tax=Aegilops tauschii subsp. strangulata TaxID=200361 RepID=UPI00098A63D7|nr:transcription factor bHLH18-like isoform X2 [Aegilops tauschii subsp. strangulata]